MQTVISCPGCGVPAEIADRFSLPSTDGPVEHVVVDCAAGHHYRMAADRPRFPSQPDPPMLGPGYSTRGGDGRASLPRSHRAVSASTGSAASWQVSAAAAALSGASSDAA